MTEKNSEKKPANSWAWIVRNLVLAAVFVLVIVFGINIFLRAVTQHGKELSVPDFTNMAVSEARYNAQKIGIEIAVADSVYVRGMKRGVVFTQNPKPGASVKKGRRVFLTINAVTAKKVTIPSLVGTSMRQAKAELTSRGLTVGRLMYVNDIATNMVLRQLVSNQQVAAGTMVDSGTKVDLVLGLNEDDLYTYVPDVTGMKYLRAVDALKDNSLNVSKLVFDPSVKTYSDSVDAVVTRQAPAADGEPLRKGAEVTLYFK